MAIVKDKKLGVPAWENICLDWRGIGLLFDRQIFLSKSFGDPMVSKSKNL